MKTGWGWWAEGWDRREDGRGLGTPVPHRVRDGGGRRGGFGEGFCCGISLFARNLFVVVCYLVRDGRGRW